VSAADPTLAIAAYLKAQKVIDEAVEGRIFRPDLPQGEDIHMPRACVLVRPAGGGQLFGRDYLGVMDSRIDIVCYGSTRLEAENIGREVQLALKNLRRSTWEKVSVRWARIAGGPASAIDPTTLWALCLLTAQVMHGTETVS
jgi:hypothetical protein